MKHKHCDVIKAWADGAVVQVNTRVIGWVTIPTPVWMEDKEYRASIAEVEGKPVFEGDELYGYFGLKFKASKSFNWNYQIESGDYPVSWNPPAPKTVMVELLREDVGYISDGKFTAINGAPLDPWIRMRSAFKKALDKQ